MVEKSDSSHALKLIILETDNYFTTNATFFETIKDDLMIIRLNYQDRGIFISLFRVFRGFDGWVVN